MVSNQHQTADAWFRLGIRNASGLGIPGYDGCHLVAGMGALRGGHPTPRVGQGGNGLMWMMLHDAWFNDSDRLMVSIHGLIVRKTGFGMPGDDLDFMLGLFPVWESMGSWDWKH